MIEVRFFATLRKGRGKISEIPAEEVSSAGTSAILPLPSRSVAKKRTSIMKSLPWIFKKGEARCLSLAVEYTYLPTHSSRPSFLRVSSVGKALTQPRTA